MKISQLKELFSSYNDNRKNADYEIMHMKKQITSLEIEVIKNKKAIDDLLQKQVVISSEVILNFDTIRATTITINGFLNKLTMLKRCALTVSTWVLFFITIGLAVCAVVYYV